MRIEIVINLYLAGGRRSLARRASEGKVNRATERMASCSAAQRAVPSLARRAGFVGGVRRGAVDQPGGFINTSWDPRAGGAVDKPGGINNEKKCEAGILIHQLAVRGSGIL